MKESRPEDAPNPAHMGDASQVYECQADAFMVGDPDWWSYGPGFEEWEKDPAGIWRTAREIRSIEAEIDREDEDRDEDEEEADDEDRLPENGPHAGRDAPAEPARDFVRGPRITVV